MLGVQVFYNPHLIHDRVLGDHDIPKHQLCALLQD